MSSDPRESSRSPGPPPSLPEGERWDGEAAWRNAIGSSSSRWFTERNVRHWPETAAARLERAVVIPRVVPRFGLSREDSIFTIGSCFARSIENHLLARGYRVATRPVSIPDIELRSGLGPRTGATEAVLNKFTTHSMLNELRWALRPGCPFPEESVVEESGGAWVDLQVVPEVAPAARSAVLARRPLIAEIYRRVARCRIVVLTLGLVEAWYDNLTGIYLNRAPQYWVVKRAKGRFSLHVLDYRANRDALEEIRALLKEVCGPDLKIVVTVSPVPMSETFTGRDVLLANAYSKSTLRAVADDFAHAHDDVDYFPSYETVVLSDRRVAFQDDLHHVASPIVDVIVARFLSLYGDGAGADEEAVHRFARERMARHEGDLLSENAALRRELGEALRKLDELHGREKAPRFHDVQRLAPDDSVKSEDGRVLSASSSIAGCAEMGERIGENYVVSGWAADRLEPGVPAGVVVFVDGVAAARTLTSLPRRDVEAALGLGRADVGFRLSVPAPPTDRVPTVRVFGVSSTAQVRELAYFELYSLPRTGGGSSGGER